MEYLSWRIADPMSGSLDRHAGEENDHRRQASMLIMRYHALTTTLSYSNHYGVFLIIKMARGAR